MTSNLDVLAPTAMNWIHVPIRAAARWAAAVLLTVAVAPAQADVLEFRGTVEASQRAELSSRIDGVVSDILFAGGERVAPGDPLILLDRADAELALEIARAGVARAEAETLFARGESERVRTLSQRGVSSPARRQASDLALRRAEASLATARAALRRAELDLERTVIRAAIDGVVGRPLTAVGAFVEAESGAPLGEILRIDPVVVAYRVPFAVRLATLQSAGVQTLEALFERISLRVSLPDGRVLAEGAKPEAASAAVDRNDGTLLVWATVANPERLLRPGMDVIVRSTVAPD